MKGMERHEENLRRFLCWFMISLLKPVEVAYEGR